MYENPYLQNPYLQQRFYQQPQQYQQMQQLQQPSQQIQQPQFQSQQLPQLIGRPVNQVEEITANDVPMNAPYALFPKSDLSEIYLKSWTANGSMLDRVLCHELTHAVCMTYNLYMPIETEEKLCNFMSDHGKEIIYLLDDLLENILILRVA